MTAPALPLVWLRFFDRLKSAFSAAEPCDTVQEHLSGGLFLLGGLNVNARCQYVEAAVIKYVKRNANLGLLMTSYPQGGVDSGRTIRLKLRITF